MRDGRNEALIRKVAGMICLQPGVRLSCPAQIPLDLRA